MLIILASLTAVSAVDTNKTDYIVAEDSDIVTQDILADENVNVGDFNSLQNEINTTEENLFKLERNYTFNPANDSNYTGGIVIDKDNFIIDGQGYTIDGANNARIFNIDGNNVTLKNINFINGQVTGNNGGALYAYENLTIVDCQFKNNSVANLGGAIYANKTLIIINSRFDENNATIGGAIFSEDELEIHNSTFENNTAKDGGAVYGQHSSKYLLLIKCSW